MNRVKGYRTMLGITQEEMASILGVSINTYRKMEENPEAFKIEHANKFLQEVNKIDSSVKMDDIFKNLV